MFRGFLSQLLLLVFLNPLQCFYGTIDGHDSAPSRISLPSPTASFLGEWLPFVFYSSQGPEPFASMDEGKWRAGVVAAHDGGSRLSRLFFSRDFPSRLMSAPLVSQDGRWYALIYDPNAEALDVSYPYLFLAQSLRSAPFSGLRTVNVRRRWWDQRDVEVKLDFFSQTGGEWKLIGFDSKRSRLLLAGRERSPENMGWTVFSLDLSKEIFALETNVGPFLHPLSPGLDGFVSVLSGKGNGSPFLFPSFATDGDTPLVSRMSYLVPSEKVGDPSLFEEVVTLINPHKRTFDSRPLIRNKRRLTDGSSNFFSLWPSAWNREKDLVATLVQEVGGDKIDVPSPIAPYSAACVVSRGADASACIGERLRTIKFNCSDFPDCEEYSLNQENWKMVVWGPYNRAVLEEKVPGEDGHSYQYFWFDPICATVFPEAIDFDGVDQFSSPLLQSGQGVLYKTNLHDDFVWEASQPSEDVVSSELKDDNVNYRVGVCQEKR